jgi:hypothetical protein
VPPAGLREVSLESVACGSLKTSRFLIFSYTGKNTFPRPPFGVLVLLIVPPAGLEPTITRPKRVVISNFTTEASSNYLDFTLKIEKKQTLRYYDINDNSQRSKIYFTNFTKSWI